MMRAGNRVRTVENGVATDYVANELNQYTSVGGFDYEYDADGNLTAKTDAAGTYRYRYDSENRLVSVTEPDGVVTTYEYNPFGDRVASVRDGQRTEYLIDPFGFGDVIGEYDEQGNVVSRYTHGLGLETLSNSSDSFYYNFNATGSTVGITNDLGSIENNYFYLPFGEDIVEDEAIPNSFEFVGQYGVAEEANGLDFMRARFFEDQTGRFISPDPIGLNGGDTNLYRYVLNNPISFIDPEGLDLVRDLQNFRDSFNPGGRFSQGLGTVSNILAVGAVLVSPFAPALIIPFCFYILNNGSWCCNLFEKP